MTINLFNPPQHAAWPGRVRSALVWNDLAQQPVYKSTKMHELDLTKEPLLPLPADLFLTPSFHSSPLVSGARPRSHSPSVLGSRVWKNKRSDWSTNDRRWAEGRSVSVSTAVAWPFTVLMNRGIHSAHIQSRKHGVFDPGNGRNVEGPCHISGRSACPYSHTAARKLPYVLRLPYIIPYK